MRSEEAETLQTFHSAHVAEELSKGPPGQALNPKPQNRLRDLIALGCSYFLKLFVGASLGFWGLWLRRRSSPGFDLLTMARLGVWGLLGKQKINTPHGFSFRGSGLRGLYLHSPKHLNVAQKATLLWFRYSLTPKLAQKASILVVFRYSRKFLEFFLAAWSSESIKKTYFGVALGFRL